VDQQERRKFVRSHRTCVFGYNREKDGPAMTVVYYVMKGNDQLLISTMAAVQGAGGGRWPEGQHLRTRREVAAHLCPGVRRRGGRPGPRLAAGVLNQVLGLMAGEPVPPERWPQVKEMARRENRVVIRVRPYATFATPGTCTRRATSTRSRTGRATRCRGDHCGQRAPGHWSRQKPGCRAWPLCGSAQGRLIGQPDRHLL